MKHIIKTYKGRLYIAIPLSPQLYKLMIDHHEDNTNFKEITYVECNN